MRRLSPQLTSRMERSKNLKGQFALLGIGGAVLVAGFIGAFYSYNSRPARAAGDFTVSGYATSQTSIHLDWDGGPGGEAEIERNGSYLPTGAVGSTDAGSYDNTGLACGTSYTYQVFDIDFGDSSNTRTIATQACAQADTTAPSLSSRNPSAGIYYRNPPLNVVVTYSDNVGVQYTRHCVASGNCDPGTSAASTFTNGGTIDVGSFNLSPGNSWFVCTRARDAAGNWSNNDCAYYERHLATPSSLNATAFGGDDIDLQWYDNSNEENGYYVYSSYNGNSYTYVATTSPFSGIGTGNYQHYNVSCGAWKYQVVAFVASADSVYSNESNTINYSCSLASPYLTNATTSLTYGTNASVTLYWSQSVPPTPDGFHIYRDGCWQGSASGSSARDYTDNSAGNCGQPQCGTTYSYVVRAFTYAGQNSDSSPRSVTTPACPDPYPSTPSLVLPANSSWTNSTTLQAAVSDSGDQVRAQFDWYWGNTYGNYVSSSGNSSGSWSNGSYSSISLRARACDDVGQCSGWTSDRTVNFDLTSPSTPGTPSGSPNPSTNGSYTVSWSGSSDSHSGVAVYDVYQNGSYNTTTASTSVGYSGKSAGTYSYYVRAFDNAGNYSTSGSGSVTVTSDTTAPTTTDNWTDSWTSSGTVNITLTATDNSGGSGVSTTYWCVDNVQSGGCDPQIDGGTGSSVSVTCGSGQTCVQYLSYFSDDNAGNRESTKEERIRQDRQGPTVSSISVQSTNGYIGSQTATLNLSASDGGSGINYMQVYPRSGCTLPNGWTEPAPIAYSTSTSVLFEPGDGQKYASVKMTDNLGNQACSPNAGVILDMTAPTPNPPTFSGTPGSNNIAWGISGATDSGSGLSSSSAYGFSTNGSSFNWQSNSWVETGLTPCTSYTRYARVRDQVGNQTSSASRTVTTTGCDSTVPTVSDNWTDNWTNASSVTVNITASDASGVWYIAHCNDDWGDLTSGCDPMDATITYSSTASETVYCSAGSGCTQYARYQAVDNSSSHNASGIATKRVRQDLQPPSVPTINVATSTVSPTSGSTFQVGWNASTDSHSGIQGYSICYYRNSTLCGSCAWNTASQLTSVMPGACFSGDATYSFTVGSVDNVGNYSSTNMVRNVIRDTAPPTVPGVCSITPNPSTGDFSINWGGSTDPAPSSVLYGYYMQYSNNGGSSWSDTVPGVSQPIQNPPVAVTGMSIGSHMYRTRAVDYIGNFSNWSSGCTATVQSTDTAAPTISVSVVPNTPSGRTWSTNCTSTSSTNCTTSSNQPTIRITYSDPAGMNVGTLSNIPDMYFRGSLVLCSSPRFSSCSATNTQTDIVFTNGDNNGTLTIPLSFIRDTLGNARTDTLTVTINNQAPTITIQ